MYVCKKLINSDLLQLAILVSLLQLDLNSYLDGLWNSRLQANDIFLGTNIAYSQTRFNYLHNTINGYIHPKNIDAILYERSSIFAELNSLGRYSHFQPLQNNVFAYLVDQEDHQIQESPPQYSLPDSSGNPAESANVQDVNVNNRNGAREIRNETNSESHETSNILTSPGSELSHEDMNLIEILWKQDIDLGLTKDAFDFRSSKEVVKPKQSEELLKPEKEPPKDVQPQPSVFNPWEGVSYIIDGETGEHIIQPSAIEQCLPNIENCSLSDFDLEQLSEELQNVPLDETLHLLNNECLGNQTNNLKKDRDYNSEFLGLEYGNCSNSITLNDVVNDDSLIDELKELDTLLGKDEDSECQINGMYSDAGNCWQDVTDLLLPPPSLSTDQSRTLQSRIAVHEPVSSGDEISSVISTINASFSEAFNNSALQNTFDTLRLSFNTTEPNCISSSLSSSFAPFSNHTDPVSEGTMNVTYDHNFPTLFGPENASIPDFLSNILFDEDLQLMDMSYGEGGGDFPINKLVQDHKDTSRDSALSSMDSDRSSSDDESMDYTSQVASNYDDSFRMGSSASSYASGGSTDSSDNYHSTAQKKYKLFGKKALRFHDKNSNENTDEDKQETHKKHPQNSKHFSFEEHNLNDDYRGSFNFLPADSSFNKKDLSENYNISKQNDLSSTKNLNENIHHNHTYNLPFESKSHNHKPISRDKDIDLTEAGKDERRAQALKLPISNHDIINLPIDEFNERVSRYNLNDAQLVLIRDIRRRGKNKVAAQNCRKRKIGQIVDLQQELESLLEEKATLVAEHEKMLSHRHVIVDKYNQLYSFIEQNTLSDPQPPKPPDFIRQLALNEKEKESSIPSNSTSSNGDNNCKWSKGARSKRKTDKK